MPTTIEAPVADLRHGGCRGGTDPTDDIEKATKARFRRAPTSLIAVGSVRPAAERCSAQSRQSGVGWRTALSQSAHGVGAGSQRGSPRAERSRERPEHGEAGAGGRREDRRSRRDDEREVAEVMCGIAPTLITVSHRHVE
mmetsp:Transcript_151718/g.486802  ORF Transcript_151718/g.486802 Transcript_151718/m.486802 type:complete len:140 (-) Transcript_151718:159-578(-)